MADNGRSQPLAAVPSKDEICQGQMWLLEPSGETHNDEIGKILGTEKLQNSRLTLIPIHEDLKPSSLKEDYEKNGHKRGGVLNDVETIPPRQPKPHVPEGPGNTSSSEHPNALVDQTSLATSRTSRAVESSAGKPYIDLPLCYARVLKETCPHCILLGNILWRNVKQVESRYESRFRPWKEKDEETGKERACFLQFHTMQAPVLADIEVTLALVHHLYISNDPENKQPAFDKKNEQILAFIYVKDTMEDRNKNNKKVGDVTRSIIENRLLPSIKFYQEEHHGYENGVDPNCGSIGLTPMLFLGVLLKWYGFKAANKVVDGFESLTKIDEELMAEEKSLRHGSIKKKAAKCNDLNAQLATLNKSLTGLRSRVHYVAESARNMRSDKCTMTEYVMDELKRSEYENFRSLKPCLEESLQLLDSSRFVKRDNDKFDLIHRAMQQYQVDIKSLKVHLTINIGLVSNHYSQLLAEAAARDGYLVLVFTVVGLILLPFTFAAILLTGPMFDFSGILRWNTIARALAWKIWGIISAGVIILFSLIFLGLYLFQHRKVTREEKKEGSPTPNGGPTINGKRDDEPLPKGGVRAQFKTRRWKQARAGINV